MLSLLYDGEIKMCIVIDESSHLPDASQLVLTRTGAPDCVAFLGHGRVKVDTKILDRRCRTAVSHPVAGVVWKSWTAAGVFLTR